MNNEVFDRIDEALRSDGTNAVFEVLANQAREDKNYPLLFDIRLLHKRHELRLPLIQVDEAESMPPETRRLYDIAYVEGAREVGSLFLADGNIQRAWPYFRAIGDTAPIAAAIEKLDIHENVEPYIEIAFMERVHLYKGFEMILAKYGICRAITCFGQFPVREGRDKSLRLLVRTLHAELADRLQRAIAGVEGKTPETQSITELIGGRDWLFDSGSAYTDTSHVISIVRFCLDLDDPETLALAEELTRYGSHLRNVYEEPSEPPFENFYVDHGIYFRALQGKDVEASIEHFRKKAEGEDPETAAQVLVALLARLKRYDEAIEQYQRFLADIHPSQLTCPSLVQLCYLARDYARLKQAARDRGDVVSYTAQALASR